MIEPIDIGPDPLPNNGKGLPEGASYEDLGWTDEASIALYGFTPQQAANRAVTRLLRPDFGPIYYKIESTDADGPGGKPGEFTEADADREATALVRKQQMAIDYFAGKLSWYDLSTQLGLSKRELGAIDISQIRDLGA